MIRAYYNENDAYAAEYLRRLIAGGHIAPGDVDERSIEDVRPDDLCGYTQCHFFAGVGIWSAALRCAGWDDARPVWTGSCPCQPFSAAGKGKGMSDERHLWPHWHHLIRECRPSAIFGEQVASKDGLAWLDTVQADLEGEDYACGASDTCAAGFGAPHIRQRQYFAAYDLRLVLQGVDHTTGPRRDAAGQGSEAETRDQTRLCGPECGCGVDRLADTSCDGAECIPGNDGEKAGIQTEERPDVCAALHQRSGATDGLGNSLGPGLEGHSGNGHRSGQPGRDGAIEDRSVAETSGSCGMGDTCCEPGQRHAGSFPGPEAKSSVAGSADGRHGDGHPDAGETGFMGRYEGPGPVNGFWRDADWLFSRDDKWRPARPGTFPLAHGVAGRVGQLRTAGNGIVLPQATEFIRASHAAFAELRRVRLTGDIFS